MAKYNINCLKVVFFFQVEQFHDFFFLQIESIDPEVLCPPSSNGEFQEMMMWLLCGLLLILIVLVLLNLAHSAHKYRTRGQLPWLALKMH